MEQAKPFLNNSFFDNIEERKNKKLWEKVENDEQSDMTEIIEEAEFFYPKKNKMQYYFLCKNCIYCSKENYDKIPTSVNKKMNLKFVRMELVEKSEEDKKFPFGFIFLDKNQKYIILTKNEDVFLRWKNYLRYICIMHTFHSEFNVTKLIGKGLFFIY